jgi:HEPN domain-containing protein
MLRKQTSENDPADWFAFAEERVMAADSLWKDLGLTAAGIELLQEAVERYLKGYLIAKNWKLVKTHDLERLLLDALQFEQAFAKFKSLALELTEDFFAQHYPGEDTADVGINYERMRRETGELISLIKQQVPRFFPNK